MSHASSSGRTSVRRRIAVGATALAIAAGLSATLSACGTDGITAQAESGDEKGFVAGAGTVTTWAPEDRGDPVTLTGTSYEGEAIDVGQWRGAPVLVNFWYAACPPCRAEAPDLVALANSSTPTDPVHVVGVNSRDDAGTAQAFQTTFAVPYPSIDDTDGKAVASMQGVVSLQAVPTTVILDAKGRVAARVLGKADPSTLDALLSDLRAEDS